MRKCGKAEVRRKMDDTYLSFYLKANRVHIFVDALRAIGSPKYICFLMESDGRTLLLKAYPKKDFRSLKVPLEVYRGKKSMEVSSMGLCRIVSQIQCWDCNYSYRVPGTIIQQKELCIFYLEKGKQISLVKRL